LCRKFGFGKEGGIAKRKKGFRKGGSEQGNRKRRRIKGVVKKPENPNLQVSREKIQRKKKEHKKNKRVAPHRKRSC